jgi:hypothetical protein
LPDAEVNHNFIAGKKTIRALHDSPLNAALRLNANQGTDGVQTALSDDFKTNPIPHPLLLGDVVIHTRAGFNEWLSAIE